jgi:hypothetical protein
MPPTKNVQADCEESDSPEGTPGVELALQALHVGQEVNDVEVRVVLLGGNASCR